ncbi:MAG: hypothetical protein MI919_05945, partial [Holophagales bacterium]|nr:hypothetical protein [Holophagales bacterium]
MSPILASVARGAGSTGRSAEKRRPAGPRALGLGSDLGSAGWVVAFVLAFLLQLESRQPFYFLWDDNASFFLPCYTFDYETLLEHGRPAHLNYHQYLGYTYLASGQTGVLYPPVYLAMA